MAFSMLLWNALFTYRLVLDDSASCEHTTQFAVCLPTFNYLLLHSRDKLPQTFPVFSTLHSAGWRPGDKASHSLKHYDSTDLHSLWDFVQAMFEGSLKSVHVPDICLKAEWLVRSYEGTMLTFLTLGNRTGISTWEVCMSCVDTNQSMLSMHNS